MPIESVLANLWQCFNLDQRLSARQAIFIFSTTGNNNYPKNMIVEADLVSFRTENFTGAKGTRAASVAHRNCKSTRD
jgi:hypothetical protein